MRQESKILGWHLLSNLLSHPIAWALSALTLFFAFYTPYNAYQTVYLDTPEPWGQFFQDNATPQMEGLEELHNNIMFYTSIITFSVTWIIISIVINYKLKSTKISNKCGDKESKDQEFILESRIMWILVLFFFTSEVILATGSILEFLPFYGVNRNFDDNEFLRGLYPNHNLDVDDRVHYIYFLAEQLAFMNNYLLGITQRFHELEPWEHELEDWEHLTVELRARLVLLRAELRTIFLALTDEIIEENDPLQPAHDALLRQYEVFDNRMRAIMDHYRHHPNIRDRQYQFNYQFHTANRMAAILSISFFIIFAAGATCLGVPAENLAISM